MNDARQDGSALIVGLTLLALVSVLAIAGSSATRVQSQLARQDHFRQNAASAASAGVESAINRIETSAAATDVPEMLQDSLTSLPARYETRIRFLGYEVGLPQSGGNLVGAHFEILSSGHAARGAYDHQRAVVMKVVAAPQPAQTAECEPLVPQVTCRRAGELRRLSWQRVPR